MTTDAAASSEPVIPPSRRSFVPWIVWAHVIMVAVGVGFVYLSASAKRAENRATLPAYAKVPDFQLINSAGEPFGLPDLDGRVWIADFVYTTCPGPCPMVTKRMAEFQEVIQHVPEARLVTFTVNPEVDTPDRLREYARNFKAGEQWVFLTGEKDDVYAVIEKGVLLPVMEQKGEGMEPVLHSTKLVLVDGSGSIRGYYDSTRIEEMRQLEADIGRILR